MATEVERLVVRLIGDASSLAGALKGSEAALKRFSGVASTSSANIGRSIKGALTSVKTLLGVGSAVGAVGWGVKLAADAEQAEIAFTTMLGSAESAKKMLSDLEEFAAATPFQLPELRDAARNLAAFGISQEKILPTLRALGDVSAGLNIPIGEIAEIYGKARVQGRLFMEDINQLTGRGIPIIGELAKQFGVAESEIRDMVSSGEVNFRHLEVAFQNLTGAGGMFYGLMAAQSKSTAGLFSTLKDNINRVMKDIGKIVIEGFDLRGVTQRLTEFVQQYQTIFVERVRFGIESVKQSFSSWKQALGPIISNIARALWDILKWFNQLTPTQKAWTAGLLAASLAARPLIGLLSGMQFGLMGLVGTFASAAAGAYALGKAIGEASERTRELRDLTAQAEEATAAASRRVAEAQSEIFQEASQMGAEEAGRFLQERLDRERRRVLATQEQIRKQQERLAGPLAERRTTQYGPSIGGAGYEQGAEGRRIAREATEGILQDTQRRLASEREFVRRLEDEIAARRNLAETTARQVEEIEQVARGSEKANSSAQTLLDNWRMMAETVGMTARQADIYAVKQKGVEEGLLNQLKAADQFLSSQEKIAEKAQEIGESLGQGFGRMLGMIFGAPADIGKMIGKGVAAVGKSVTRVAPEQREAALIGSAEARRRLQEHRARLLAKPTTNEQKDTDNLEKIEEHLETMKKKAQEKAEQVINFFAANLRGKTA